MRIVGIDEVGRGCWAGPMVAGAVLLHTPISGLKDSKLLTRIAREQLAKQILDSAFGVGLGWVSAEIIDEVGLTKALTIAMHDALSQITHTYDRIVIDGNYNFMPDNPLSQAVIKADSLYASVSAASIVAKVARDAYMYELATTLPQYGFEKHVGYGTALHAKNLATYGVSTFHRKSFKPIKALFV